MYPVTALQLNGPLEFVLAPSSEHYTDLQKTILYLKCKIMLKDGNQIVRKAEGDAGFNKTLVAPICYFHATQFKGVEVFLNSVPVTHLDNLYPYRAYLETLLTFGSESKEGQLQSALFCKDEGDHNWIEAGLAKTPPDGEDNPRWSYIKLEIKNPGARERFQRTKYSRAFETFGRIHNELFTQGKLLPGGCELRIRLHRADPQFCLMAKDHDENYVVQIDKAILMVRQCRISSAIRESHARMRLEKPIKYPTRKVQMKFFTKGTGISDLSEPNLVNGILPRRIVIGFVDSSAFNGHLGKNPFKFEHVKIRSITLRRDEDAVPFESIEMDLNVDESVSNRVTSACCKELGDCIKTRASTSHQRNTLMVILYLPLTCQATTVDVDSLICWKKDELVLRSNYKHRLPKLSLWLFTWKQTTSMP